MFLNRINKFLNGGEIFFKHRLRFIIPKYFSSNQNSLDLSIKFIDICKIFHEIEKNSKLLQKKKIFTSFLMKSMNFESELNTDKIEINNKKIGEIINISLPYLNLIQNKSDFIDKQDPIEINLKYQYTFDLLIRNYIKEKFGIEEREIQKNFLKYGDLAKYLHNLHESNNSVEEAIDDESLTVREVLEYKEKIVKAIGNKSYAEKLELFSELIEKCKSPLEILYLARIFLNKLKIGMAEKNVINSILELEKTFVINQVKLKKFRELLNYLEKNIFKYQIYYKRHLRASNNNEDIEDPENVDFEFSLKPGVFVELQLGRPGMDLDVFLSTISKSTLKCIVETKYDGERSQLHFDGYQIYMGSRSLQDQTLLYQNLKQDILNEIFNKNHGIKNFIIDGEVVSYSHKHKIFNNFQELRKKINTQEESNLEIQYFFVAFDILYLNDINLHHLPLENRKTILKKNFYNKFKNIIVEYGTMIDLKTNSLESCKKEIINLFNFSKRINCEGLVGKELGRSSEYNFGKRKWFKLKTLNTSMSETLDLVPIAGFIGKGSTNSLINSFLVAAYEPEKKNFIGICKLGTGFDQKDLLDIRNRFLPHLLNDIPHNYFIPRLQRPTFIFKPREVWEVGFDSFSESMNYSIGKGIIFENKGLSLRFPRFIKFRPDKKVEDASTTDFIIELYNNLNNSEEKTIF